jgi:hypothetical protein
MNLETLLELLRSKFDVQPTDGPDEWIVWFKGDVVAWFQLGPGNYVWKNTWSWPEETLGPEKGSGILMSMNSFWEEVKTTS